AIKAAENDGLVSTIERVGTLRIEKKKEKVIERLTLGEVAQVVEGEVIGGIAGLNKVLNNFIIGAMQKESISRYITKGGLMIVGNRENIQKYALENQMAVLITGGFETQEGIIELANKISIPIIKTNYDTFTATTLINKAMSDQLIKRDIVHVSDVMIPIAKTDYLKIGDTVEDYLELASKTGNSKMPVVNSLQRVVGVVTEKDVFQKEKQLPIEKLMTKNPITTKENISIASVSHQMIWDGIEMLPITNDAGTLLGVIGRFDIMRATQMMQRSGQVTATINDQISGMTTTIEEGSLVEVVPTMVNSMGLLSYGVLSEIIVETVSQKINEHFSSNIMIESLNIHYLKMMQIESKLKIIPKILDSSRRHAVVEVDVLNGNVLASKATIALQMMERN
ncbi:MAG: CBS domain-containing protein, partial [Streptococcaceae bacterium]|nr:CBS domain-containing protein [Streptococcaceae bacterium]